MVLIVFTRLFGCAYGLITILILLRLLSLIIAGKHSKPSAMFLVFLWPLLLCTEHGRDALDSVLKERPDATEEKSDAKKK